METSCKQKNELCQNFFAGPVFFGWTIQFANNDYRLMMVIAPIVFLLAFFMMIGVRRGEVQTENNFTQS